VVRKRPHIGRFLTRQQSAVRLSLTFAALADPTRRSILARLAEGEATVNELAEPFSSGCSRASGPGRHLWTGSTPTSARKEIKMSDSTPATAADQEVLITRIFDAPREQVFRVEPELLVLRSDPTATRRARRSATGRYRPRAAGTPKPAGTPPSTSSPRSSAPKGTAV
jgi:DNA-binding transcriptional ArsR family regulator